MLKCTPLLLAAAALLLCTGCSMTRHAEEFVGLKADHSQYTGPVYPPTSKIAIAFQADQIPKSCRVFAQVMVQFPENSTGKQIADAVLAEAGKRGADRVLIGQTRQSNNDEGPTFLYFGPQNEYFCDARCGSWSYGYGYWEALGQWVDFGYKEWQDSKVQFESPVMTELLMVRCQ